MSKMLDDKTKSSPNNSTQEKKRSKSPSSLIEFAQRKLPKWASFIKKSDEDSESSSKVSTPDSSKLKRNVVNEKSKSAEEYDRGNKCIPPKPHSSEEYDRETRYKGILRRKAVEYSVDVFDTEKLQTPSTSKGSKKSPDVEPHSSNRLYAFSFLGRSKERKDNKTETKSKHKSTDRDNSQLSPRDSEKSPTSSKKRSQSETRSKKSNKSDSKPASFEEKTKSFFKQKSKEKSNESSRKNSINFGTLREKYSKWTKSVKDDTVKAVSAEGLEGVDSAAERLLHCEFLAASMRILLSVSPPFTRFPVRSRSLSNLDALDTRRMRLLDNHFMARMLYGVRPSTQPLWYSSIPDVTAYNYTKGIVYQPGPTSRRSIFVRQTKTTLRHTFSSCSLRDFFQLSIPASFENSDSIDDRTIENRRFLNSCIFVPAVGNVTLRKATQNLLKRRRSLGHISIADYSAQINGCPTLFKTDVIDSGQLGGSRVILHDINKLRIYRNPSVELLPKSNESIKLSPVSSAPKDSKMPFRQRLKWSHIFRTKESTANMEKLSLMLNKYTIRLPRLPPDKQIQYNSLKASVVLTYLVDKPFETIVNSTGLSPNEEIIQRAIYELVATEAEYIDDMNTIVEMFLAVAINIQSNNLMLEVDLDRLFVNVVEILQSNIIFWETAFYPMIAEAVLNGGPSAHIVKFNTVYLYDGFVMFPEIFFPYREYVENQKSSQAYCRELVEESSLFAAYLAWCEAQKRCRRLRLTDMLVKPMQRLTKYGLLLNTIYNLYEGEPEKLTIRRMYHKCRKFTFDLNCHIRYLEEVEQMNNLIEIIDSFDGVETKDEEVDIYLRMHTNLNLKEPIKINGVKFHRSIVLEGDIKFKDAKDKLEVRAVLFSDYMLILFPSKRKKPLYKVIRPKMMVENMHVYPQYYMKDGVKELSSIIIINVDSTGTANGYFSLHEIKESNQPELKTWLFAIKEAQVAIFMLGDLAIHRVSQDPRSEYYNIDEYYNYASDIEKIQTLKNNSTDEDGAILEPMEALMPAITAASKKRICTMIHGAEVPKDGSRPPRPEVISVPERPYTTRSCSFGSSVHHSHSGSYECYDWETVGTAIFINSGDTSTGRTISFSSEEDPSSSLLYNVISDARHPIIMTHSPMGVHPNMKKNYLHPGAQTVATIEPVAHCSKNPPPVVTKIVCTPVTDTKSNVPRGNTLTVEPHHYVLRQSMPDLANNLINPVRTTVVSKNTLNVPSHTSRRLPRLGTTKRHRLRTPDKFLSPDTRGTSYPPPSTSRASLRRAFAFSSTSGHPV